MRDSTKLTVESSQSFSQVLLVETSASYLNSLSPDQAISFLSSLQTVRDHLTRELEGMTQQVQKKTLRLESIQALLAEAGALEVTTPEPTSSTDETVSQESIAAAISELATLPVPDSVNTKETQEEMPTPNGNLPTQPKPKSSSKGDRTKPTSSKAQPKGKSVPTSKTNTPPAKKLTPKTPSAKKLELREFLLPKFQGNALTDVVAQILASATKPLHLNDLLLEMYGTLPTQTAEKAKISLANVLSTGKKQGKWQSLGDGKYAAKTVVAK